MARDRFIPIEQRVEQWKQFYARANTRPLLGFFVRSEYPLPRYPASRGLPEGRDLRPEDFDVAAYLDDYDALFAEHEACGGDFIYAASAYWGIPWLEAGLGCAIRADHSTGSIYALSPCEPIGPEDLPPFDPASPWMAKAVEFLQAIDERSAGRYPLATTRMRGIADLLQAFYGPEQIVYLMADEPERIHAVCRALTDYWLAFARLQLEHIPPFHGGIGSFYYHAWAPAGTVWHQEDAAALLSPDLYDEFIRPYDQRIIESLSGCIMHQHPTRFVPTDFYVQMPFLALELHVDEGGPTAEELYPAHCKILERKPLFIWGHLSQADLDWIFSKLPPQGLAVLTTVSNPEEAAQIWERYM